MSSPPPGTSLLGASDAESPLVLIVEDNEMNLKLTRDVLRAAGFRTLEAASGAEGIELAAERLPDVILLDLRLPDIDGNDVVLRLRTGARTSCIPVVALTALVSLGDALVDAGFDGFLSKPIDVRAFPNQVRKYCRRRPA